MADDELTLMTLHEITSGWRPGSHDSADTPDGWNVAWTWKDEAHDLLTRDRDRTAGVVARVMREGIDYGNEYGAHICLGSDGRVWDGHHRIVAALALGIDNAYVDVVKPAATGADTETVTYDGFGAPIVRDGGETDG